MCASGSKGDVALVPRDLSFPPRERVLGTRLRGCLVAKQKIETTETLVSSCVLTQAQFFMSARMQVGFFAKISLMRIT